MISPQVYLGGKKRRDNPASFKLSRDKKEKAD
jgi:hypothetical protein